MIINRITELNKKMLETPEFIPSLTSIKQYGNYINLLTYLANQNITHLMISAYDLYYIKKENATLFGNKLQESKNLFFMDSGTFEFYNGLFSKQWNNELLIHTAKTLNPDILVSLDNLNTNSNRVSLEDLEYYNDMRCKLREDKQFYEIVIQEKKIEHIKLFLNNLEIDKKLLALCVPERNLGNSFSTRKKNLKILIKTIKEDFGYEQILFHLMGCSYPSFLINYSKIGVDLFDGIHWNDLLYLPNENNFTDLSRLIEIDCSCIYCKTLKNLIKINKNNLEKYYMYYVLSHNLENYKNLMQKIRKGEI